MSNVYYSPEKFGLEILGELDFGGAWEFDKYVVWWHEETQKAYWGHDSGCSCPSPFEGFNSLEDLTEFSIIPDMPKTDEVQTFTTDIIRAINKKK